MTAAAWRRSAVTGNSAGTGVVRLYFVAATAALSFARPPEVTATISAAIASAIWAGERPPRSRPGRAVDPVELGLREALLGERCAAALLRPLGADRADVAGVPLERRGDRRDVEPLLVARA